MLVGAVFGEWTGFLLVLSMLVSASVGFLALGRRSVPVQTDDQRRPHPGDETQRRRGDPPALDPVAVRKGSAVRQMTEAFIKAGVEAAERHRAPVR
jgi:hypothetical protein